MHEACNELAMEAGRRLRTLLNAKRYFSVAETMRLYKSKVLQFIINSTPAIYYTSNTTLSTVDRVQSRLLRELALTEVRALEDLKLAPLASRRNIAMLGATYCIRIVGANAISRKNYDVSSFTETAADGRLRKWRPRHTHQLSNPTTFASTTVMQRSIFGLVYCYNRLPQAIVDVPSIKSQERSLQAALVKTARSG